MYKEIVNELSELNYPTTKKVNLKAKVKTLLKKVALSLHPSLLPAMTFIENHLEHSSRLPRNPIIQLGQKASRLEAARH